MLTGRVSALFELAMVIDVRGVGYFVRTPTATTTWVVDSMVTVHTHLAVRETALDLYGFMSQSELELFELLLGVPKIGPKSALQILNQASPTLLVESISTKDADRLHKLAGVGKKTSESVVQYLHDKLDGLAFIIVPTMTVSSPAKTDAIDALVSLGYDLAHARQIIGQYSDDATVNELVTKALKELH